MKKEKFELTSDIIKVEKEPAASPPISPSQETHKPIFKERISLNIDSQLKMNLHLHCVQNKRAMTDVIEECLRHFLQKNTISS
jgi:hypothetical protein